MLGIRDFGFGILENTVRLGSMTLHINGEPKVFEYDLTVSKLLERLSVKVPAVAVEVNRAIVPRSRYETHRLQDGDRIEIVTFVGGG